MALFAIRKINQFPGIKVHCDPKMTIRTLSEHLGTDLYIDGTPLTPEFLKDSVEVTGRVIVRNGDQSSALIVEEISGRENIREFLYCEYRKVNDDIKEDIAFDLDNLESTPDDSYFEDEGDLDLDFEENDPFMEMDF